MANSLVLPVLYVFGLGPLELIVILVIVLVIFGPRNLPKIGKALGESIRSLKRSSEGLDEEEESKEKKEEKKEKEKKEEE